MDLVKHVKPYLTFLEEEEGKEVSEFVRDVVKTMEDEGIFFPSEKFKDRNIPDFDQDNLGFHIETPDEVKAEVLSNLEDADVINKVREKLLSFMAELTHDHDIAKEMVDELMNDFESKSKKVEA